MQYRHSWGKVLHTAEIEVCLGIYSNTFSCTALEVWPRGKHTFILRTTTSYLNHNPTSDSKPCPTSFGNDPRRQVGQQLDQAHVRIATIIAVQTSFLPPAKKQRLIDATKMFLDIAKESADALPPLKSCLGGINALIKHYEVRSHRINPLPR